MTITIPNEIALDIADLFDEFTPRNKIDKAILIIRKRNDDDYNFWTKLAAQIRTATELPDAGESSETAADSERVIGLETPTDNQTFTEEREDPVPPLTEEQEAEQTLTDAEYLRAQGKDKQADFIEKSEKIVSVIRMADAILNVPTEPLEPEVESKPYSLKIPRRKRTKP